jgi:hypothetical protein
VQCTTRVTSPQRWRIGTSTSTRQAGGRAGGEATGCAGASAAAIAMQTQGQAIHRPAHTTQQQVKVRWVVATSAPVSSRLAVSRVGGYGALAVVGRRCLLLGRPVFVYSRGRRVGHIKNYERGFVAIGAWLVGRTPISDLGPHPIPLSLRSSSSAANPSFHHYY